jgi:amino acid transporter
MLQFTRTLFAKGRDGALHKRYSQLHPRWKTPHVAIFFIWAAGMVLLVVSSYLPTINVILQDSINAIGFQICFYLGLTGFACAWYYRGKLAAGALAAATHVVWPAASGAFMFSIAVFSVPTFDLVTNLVGLGGIALGAVPLVLNRRKIGYFDVNTSSR